MNTSTQSSTSNPKADVLSLQRRDPKSERNSHLEHGEAVTERQRVMLRGLWRSVSERTPFHQEPKMSQSYKDLMKTSQIITELKTAVKPSQLSHESTAEIESCESSIKKSVLGKRLSFLPDELLSMVLEYSVYDARNPFQTARAAAKLSHTCRRFWSLLIRNPRLWSRINNFMSPEMIQTCCDRATATNAEVVFYTWVSQQTMSFFDVIKRRSESWRVFEVQFFHTTSREEFVQFIAGFGRVTLNMELPCLKTLFICLPRYISEISYQDVAHFYSSWSMPRLSAMSTCDFIPIPFPNSASLRTFIFDTEHSKVVDLRSLVHFLQACPKLEELTIKLLSTFAVVVPPTKRVVMSCVRKLSLRFFDCHQPVISALVESLSFPAASEVALQMRASSSRNGSVKSVISSIFSDASTFPVLKDLQLAVDSHDPEDLLSIPFSSLRNLKKLRLSKGYTGLEPIETIEREHVLPVLQSLVLENCFCIEPDWIAALLRHLMSSGHFDPTQFEVLRCRMWKIYEELESDSKGSGLRREDTQVTAEEMLQLIKPSTDDALFQVSNVISG